MIYRRDDLRLLSVYGPDAVAFLGGLISQRTDLTLGTGAYAALLTPQGKLLADFPLLRPSEDQLILALPAPLFDATLQKLRLFKLRSQITLHELEDQVLHSALTPDVLAFGDGRLEDLSHGLAARAGRADGDSAAFHAARAARGVPEGQRDMIFGKSTLLNEGLACAIDWHKGCYMGQEVTARMRYRALIKRVLLPYRGPGQAGQNLEVEGKTVGQVRSTYGDCGFAYVRKEFAGQQVAGLDLGLPIGLKDLGL